MKTFKNAGWMVICTITMLVLFQFDQLAIKELDTYGLIYRGIVWFLIVIMVIKGVLHGAEFFGDFDDLEFEFEEIKE